MSIVTVSQIGEDLRAWISAVQRGDTVAIIDGGREVARLVPALAEATAPPAQRQPAADETWVNERLAELEETFPELVIGATAELEAFRDDRF